MLAHRRSAIYDARVNWSPPRVRAARIAAGMTQRQVAEAADVSIDTVRRSEIGTHEPGANALGRIAAALGVEIGSLFVHDADAPTADAGSGRGASAVVSAR